MYIKEIEIKNFRNYENVKLDFSNKVNIIYGNNAQGKTNLLESIYFLAITKSHRSNIDSKLLHDGTSTAYIKGIICDKNRTNKYEIGFNDKVKKIKINGEQIKKISDYISRINIIIFYPEDLNIIKGSPRIRRRFLNLELSQIYGNYVDILNDYNKLLKMRNNYLKKRIPDSHYFEILTEYLVNKACDVYMMRKKFIDRLNEYNEVIYSNIMKVKGFHIKYLPNVNITNYNREDIKDCIQKELLKTKDLEKKLCMTVVGPHKDDFDLIAENKSLKEYGSQGQQRIAILSIKLAEVKVLEKYKKTHPILLLDDVFSELDDNKKNNFLKYIVRKNQVIITTTDLSMIDNKILREAKTIKIKSGKIIKMEKNYGND